MQELEQIQLFLEEQLTDDPYMVEQRGASLSVYLARTGKIYADAKADYQRALKSEIIDKILPEMAKAAGASFTVQNLLAKSACYELEHVVNLAERSHKTCVRQLDWCRSVLSKHKEELRQSQHTNVHITNQ